MRIAVVSDIHGNLSALEAVVEELRRLAPELVLCGGDIAFSGARPAEVLDRIRELGWSMVLGNCDEMLSRTASLEEFAEQLPSFSTILPVLQAIAAADRELLGEERLAWLARQPQRLDAHGLSLVHAGPASCWLSPLPDAADEELGEAYRGLGSSLAVYGHVHVPFVRALDGLVVANTGSCGMSFDGDPRASFLLVENGKPEVHRVEYDVQQELKLLAGSGLPHADWVARCLQAASMQAP